MTGELYNSSQNQLFTPSKAEAKLNKQKQEKLKKEIEQLTAYIEEVKNNKMYENAFEWRFEFPEVLNDEGDFIGFDVMLGNPPYMQLQKMGNESINLQKIGYQTYESTGDIYSLFYENSWNVLRSRGILCFITSNKWMKAAYGKSTRKFFSEETNPILLVDFGGQKIFSSATVDTNIILFSKDKNQGNTIACILRENALDNLRDYITNHSTINSFLTENSWIILLGIELSIKSKIEANGKPLKDWDVNIYRGILTGYNEALSLTARRKMS
ncbi:Eco57I restriction-modification methylase domain-containing protein [Siphonobacter sp. BAB-5405]|uniref:Eco57I restriction-modification methylase domain-containing protein n=1 Tax=Siphonobacter sp. BAB-5405 TaxID=1864825 RepID=UPI001E28F28B|nr:Eco57I restriction-modification methylase domain-containing protein [Siphonobacter sp. BAB-5405]